MEARLAEQEDGRQTLQLEKAATDGKIKKLEEDFLIMEDQNNKLHKVGLYKRKTGVQNLIY